jgi:hypothetical protein
MTGLTVDLIDTNDRTRFGHPRVQLPPQGGIVREGGVTVEVRPTIPEDEIGRSRSYDEIVALAEKAEKNGGFIRSGDEAHVGDAILAGRDLIEFLSVLWRRAEERAGDQSAAYRQGYEQARGELRRKVEEALNA